MKKINKSLPPNKLTEYATRNPTNDWAQFRTSSKRKNYQETKELIFNDQGGLCAFCEDKVQDIAKQQIEHFHSKKDNNPNHNWALDWNNMLGVCTGGKDSDKTIHPTPENLSCDAYKDHLIQKNELSVNCEGYFLNPLHIPAFPCLFELDTKERGKLKVKDSYDGIEVEDNKYDSIATLAQATIDNLNLNCLRLVDERKEVINLYEELIEKARLSNDKEIFKKLVERWFFHKWESYFTTRRILLGNHAENYLASINYNG